MTLKSAVLNIDVEDPQTGRPFALVVQAGEDDESRVDEGVSGMSDPCEYSYDQAMRGLIWGIAWELAFAFLIALCWLVCRING